MADADSTLELLVKLNVIGQADVKAAQDLLKQTATTAAGSAEAGRDMGQKLEDAGEKGTHAAKGLFESHHGVHKLLHTIGNDAAPGMGHALAALAHGPLGALIAVGMAVEFVKKNIEETNKKLDEMSANASKAFGGSDWLTDYVNAAAQAATETENLAAALHKASDAGPEIKNRYDGEAKAIKDIVDAIKEKLKAQEESDLAEARASAKKSGASPEVAAATESAIRARYESQADATSDAAEQALQQARGRELEERQKNDAALKEKAAAALTPGNVIQQRTARDTALKAQEAALGSATSDLNTEANDKLNEKLEGLKQGLENMHRTGSRDSLIRAREAEIAQLESETAESREANAKERIGQLSKEVANDTKKAGQEKIIQEDAQSAATENAARIVSLNKEISDHNTAAKIKDLPLSKLIGSLGPYENVKTLEKTAGVDTEGGAAAFVHKFSEAQSRLMQHKGTAADSETVKLMNQLLKGTQQADGHTNQVLHNLIEHNAEIVKAMAAMARKTNDQIRQLQRPQS